MTEPIVEIKNARKYFNIPGKGVLHAVDDVSFTIYKGETLGLVGESGCGKSTLGNVIMRLLPINGGSVLYKGVDVVSLKGAASKKMCKNMQLIFQDPYSSLNPRKNVRKILQEPFLVQKLCARDKLNYEVERLCELTGITEDDLEKYPHELDGGKRQIIGITRALSLNPDFIVCDEPVSALDVSVQARIINLLMSLQQQFGLAYLFVSHDLSVVRHISNRVAVMYLGKIVELCPCDEIYGSPMHPYTKALLSAIPKISAGPSEEQGERIILNGDVPSPINPAPGCRFAGRCWMVGDKCLELMPELTEKTPGHFCACHFCK